MKVVVGLGNPGPEYAFTRHNLGYRVAESFASRHGALHFHRDGLALAARVHCGTEVLVLKPVTFMNLSGEAVHQAVAGQAVSGEDLLVAHDDLDLDLGRVAVKVGGGHGGHRGLMSIAAEIGDSEFVRVRLGIKRPEPGIDAARWVLDPFDQSEQEVVGDMVERGADAVDAVLRLGAHRAMNQINRKPGRESAPGAPGAEAS